MPVRPDPNGACIQETVRYAHKHVERWRWKNGRPIDSIADAMADDLKLQQKRIDGEIENGGGGVLILAGVIVSLVAGIGFLSAGQWRAGLASIGGGAAANAVGWPLALDGQRRGEAALRQYNERHSCQ
jgi:hypothetical protein